ncbi:MAG: ketopantoate reductase family protein [Elusimicrobia bacterium]|nr:ketopantoate reductase family protein [Elusimicrobiota bacterium]
MLGGGVVGGILSGCLLESGVETWLVDASADRVRQLKSQGLRLRDPRRLAKGDLSVPVKAAWTSLGELPADPVDVLFVCVKACVLKHVVPDLRRFHRPGMMVVSFQNGLDTEEVLAEALGRAGVARVVVNYAGRLLEDGAVEVGFYPQPNVIGVLDPALEGRARGLAAILTSAGLKTVYSDSLHEHIWEKAILNASMSPLSALTGLTMLDVFEFPALRAVLEGITREGIAVARSCGVAFPDAFFGHCMDYLSKGGRHKPSMLVDVEAGRETEIEFLNGRICAHAQRRGVPVPHNGTITALLRAIDAGRRRPPYQDAAAAAAGARP